VKLAILVQKKIQTAVSPEITVDNITRPVKISGKLL